MTLEPNLHLARYLDARLAETGPLHGARLYGLTVNDPDAVAGGDDGAARFSLLDTGLAHDLVRSPTLDGIAAFDAVALVTGGWAAPLDELHESGGRASRHPHRRRVLVTVVSSPDDQVSSVMRFVDTGEIAATEGGAGGLPDALRHAWHVNPRTRERTSRSPA